MSKKRTLNVRISLDGDLDPDDFSNEASAIFEEYLDAILAMDEGDRMTLRDSDKRIVGRAEVTGDEPVASPFVPAQMGVPGQALAPRSFVDMPAQEVAYEETPEPPATRVTENQKFGPSSFSEFQATMEAPQKSSLGDEGMSDQLPTDFNSL